MQAFLTTCPVGSYLTKCTDMTRNSEQTWIGTLIRIGTSSTPSCGLWSWMGYTPSPTRATLSSTPLSQKTLGDCQQAWTTSLKNVLTITEEAATAPRVFSPMCAADVDLPATPHPIACRVKDSANPHKQPFSKITTPLLEQHYEPPTPIKVNRLSELLKHHPDSDKVQYMIQGLWPGFDLEYSVPFEPKTPDNLSTAAQDPQLIKDKLQKEVKLGCMVGPFKEIPFPDLICCQVGLVPKKESSELCMIMHLSYPYGGFHQQLH